MKSPLALLLTVGMSLFASEQGEPQQVILYSRENCPPCVELKKCLDEMGIKYVEGRGAETAGITTYPTVIVTVADREVLRIAGGKSKAELEAIFFEKPAAPVAAIVEEKPVSNTTNLDSLRLAKSQTQVDIMQFFNYSHLPQHLQAISKPFGDLANNLVATLPHNTELEVALRKLLEAKDAAVRAVLAK